MLALYSHLCSFNIQNIWCEVTATTTIIALWLLRLLVLLLSLLSLFLTKRALNSSLTMRSCHYSNTLFVVTNIYATNQVIPKLLTLFKYCSIHADELYTKEIAYMTDFRSMLSLSLSLSLSYIWQLRNFHRYVFYIISILDLNVDFIQTSYYSSNI